MIEENIEVVISGVSGLFPESDNFDELEKNLMNKVNLVTTDNRRWTPGDLNVPIGTGKIKNPNTFDMIFFGIHRKLCEIMDPYTRLTVEQAYSAVCDAGVNPAELAGSKTAVIMGSVTCDTEYECVTVIKNVEHAMLGQSRSMQANRVSYFLDLKGPSLSLDCSWSSGLQVINYGYNMIKRGQVPAAIVGVCSLISKPEVSALYDCMGVLNNDTKTKCFSSNADGYNRSEACAVFFLQRADYAKRSYGTIHEVISNYYGCRDTALTDFSKECYTKLLEDVYKKGDVNPNDLAFVEANGCASKRVDAMELNSITEVLCQNRQTPLPIGCVKSNLGHTEASSSFVAIAKALIAFKNGIIPPNINFDSPNPDVPGLFSGQLQVITEPTNLKGNIIGISSCGVSGSYGHIVIKQNPKSKARKLRLGQLPPDGLPRLMVISGREEKALNEIITKLESTPIDEEFVALTHGLFKTEIKRHLYRGYTLLSDGSRILRDVKPFAGGVKRPVWFVFSGMGSQWPGMGTELMKLPTFEKSIRRCQEILKPKGVDLIEIITSTDPKIFDNILNAFVGIAALQIGLVDVLKELGITPDGIVGHSVGELGCAYADGCFSLEQMILAAHARGRASIESDLIKGKMAAVGMGYNNIKDVIPPTIEVACHNASDSCTLSGPSDDMEIFINEIKNKKIFAKLVNVANIAYHSRYIKPAGPALLKYLKEVIPNPKPRSKKWISSSIPEMDWNSDLAKYSSAEYHTNNLLSSVLFEEASSHIPKDAVAIEIAPHGLLQAILKRSLSTCTNIPLTNRTDKDAVSFLFNAIGKLYLEGIEMDIATLYPKVEFPVSRETGHLSPLLTWDHSEEWIVWSYVRGGCGINFIPCWKYVNVSLLDEKFEYLSYNKIKNRIIIPLSSYLNLMIEMFTNFTKNSTSPLIIKNIKFNQFIDVPDKTQLELYLSLQRGTGNFEICYEDSAAVSGKISVMDDVSGLETEVSDIINESHVEMTKEEFYVYLKEIGFEKEKMFKKVLKVFFNENGIISTLQWDGEWVTFLDALFTLVAFFHMNNDNKLKLVTDVKQIFINPEEFPDNQIKEVEVVYNHITKILSCKGIRIFYPETVTPSIEQQEEKISVEQFKFIPYNKPSVSSLREIIDISTQTIHENINKNKDEKIILNIVNIEGNGYFTNHINCSLGCEERQIETCIKQCENDREISNFDWNKVKEEFVWIISDCDTYKKTLKVLKNAKQGFILTKRNKDILIQAANYDLQMIYEFQFDNEKIVLYKLQKSITSNKNLVSLSETNWKKKLLTNAKFEKENPGNVYVFGVIKYLSEIYDMIKECELFDQSYFFRYYFVDEKAKKFNFEDPFYRDQINHDLKVNICLNGVWGNLVLLPSINQTEEPVETVEPFDHNIFPMSTIKANNIQVTNVGLNLEDITGYTEGQQFGVLEYTGYKDGEHIFGLSHLDDGNNLVTDKLLLWNKPSNWTDEEAISVPLLYSIAYIVLQIDTYQNVDHTLLVHRGSLPVSQAIIKVALSKDIEVFTTYQSLEEKKMIQQLFPELDVDHIISCQTRNFHITVLKLTQGKGLHTLVNTMLDENMVDSSLKCLGDRSTYFQISTPPMKNKLSIGMHVFLREAIIFGLAPCTILEMPEYKKKLLQECLAEGINEGIIKPIKTKEISSSILSSTALSTLKSPENIHHKIFVSLEPKTMKRNKTDVFLCDPEKNFLIIGGEQGIWLEMVEWLILRGAKNIHIALKNNLLGKFITQRLNTMLSIHPSVEISFMSHKRLSSTASIENMFNDKNGSLELDTIFISGRGMKDKIIAIDQVLRNKKSSSRMICIGEGGEKVCERRRSSQLPALSITCNTDIKPQIIISKLDLLTSYMNESPVIFLKKSKNVTSSITYSRIMSYKHHIPANAEELVEFQKTRASKQPHFVEIKTNCPKYKYSREISPVFIFNSLKVNQLAKLASRLFHPAFEAVLPANFTSIESVASVLFNDMKKFPTNVFTLVADDWGGALALSVARLLEANNKIVLIIMLNAAPSNIQAWIKTILDANGYKLINKYLKLDSKIKKTLHLIQNWDEMLEVAIENAKVDPDYKEEIRIGISMVKCRLHALIGYKDSDTQFKGKCHLFWPKGSSENNLSDLEKYCKKVEIHIQEENTHYDMVNSEKIARLINGLVLFEYKDSPNMMDLEKLEHKILYDERYRSEGLVRV